MIRATLLALLLPLAARADSNALWKIVHGACVPHMMAGNGPAPCAVVDLPHHYALLKDRAGAEQFLVIPTDRITGIESPALEAAGAPNFWQSAWGERAFMIALAPRKLAADEVVLAINPPRFRSQSQLHIHIDCAKTAVSAKLIKLPLTAAWVPVWLGGVPYQARSFDMSENPFDLMAAEAARQHTAISDWSIATIGAHVLVATRFGATENLQDHGCEK